MVPKTGEEFPRERLGILIWSVAEEIGRKVNLWSLERDDFVVELARHTLVYLLPVDAPFLPCAERCLDRQELVQFMWSKVKCVFSHIRPGGGV